MISKMFTHNKLGEDIGDFDLCKVMDINDQKWKVISSQYRVSKLSMV
jgi:hypothetical protein